MNHRNCPSAYDHGGKPYVANIDCMSKQNPYYRTALWTGSHLQVTLMSIPVNGDVGLELHPDTDQFIRIEDGYAFVQMGNDRQHLDYEKTINSDYAIMVPAGTWHNITNAGSVPLKLYTVYAPPHHPFGTVHETKAIAEAQEH